MWAFAYTFIWLFVAGNTNAFQSRASSKLGRLPDLYDSIFMHTNNYYNMLDMRLNPNESWNVFAVIKVSVFTRAF